MWAKFTSPSWCALIISIGIHSSVMSSKSRPWCCPMRCAVFCKINVFNLFPGLPPDVSQVHQPILVCTAHIHWDPEFCDVKLIQTMMLSNELRSILEEASHSFRPGHKPDTNNIQLLLCGDFNSLPDSGKLYILLQNQYFHVSIIFANCYHSVHSLFLWSMVILVTFFEMLQQVFQKLLQ
jgi:hypothetical protein